MHITTSRHAEEGDTTCHTLKQVKQNATNNLAALLRSALNALSDGVLRFAHCVPLKDPAVDSL